MDTSSQDLTTARLGTPIALGRTAEVFALGEGEILKLLRPGFPAGIVKHEADAARIVAHVYPGAPHLIRELSVDGRIGLVYERIDGPTMDSFVKAHLGQVQRLGRTLGELHATMHGADGAGLADQVASIEAAIDGAASDLPIGARETALRRLVRMPSGSSVCHGDLHPGNVILGTARAVIIDWGNARTGNPVADVARSVYLIRDTPMQGAWLLRPVVGALRRQFVGAYLARYRELRTLDLTELRAWRLPILAARLAEGIDEERLGLLAAIQREIEVEVDPDNGH